MKQSEITVGGLYLAKVSGRIVTVRVDRIREVRIAGSSDMWRTVYDVTNLATSRRTTFRSPQKFRGRAENLPSDA